MSLTGIELHLQWPGALTLLMRATLVLAAAWIIHPALSRTNPRWRVTLWRGTLAALLFLPLTSSLVPAYTLNLPQNAGAAREFILVLSGAGGQAQSFWSRVPWLAVLWGLGVAISLWSLFSARRSLIRLVASSSTRADEELRTLLLEVSHGVGYFGALPDLRFSERVEVPFACGVFNPTVVIPERMLAPGFREELSAVLAHEASHLRSADLAWSFVAQVVRSLLWFHPFVRPVPAVHRSACEDVCNAAAAEFVGDVHKYSKTLARVALATINPPLSEGGIPMAVRATVLRRLDFLKKGISAAPLPKAAFGAFVMLAFTALVGFSALSLSCSSDDGNPVSAAAGTSVNVVKSTAQVDVKQAVEVVDGNAYLSAAEVMPKVKAMPKRPDMPAEIARQQITATTKIVFYVDADGTVNQALTRIDGSSGFQELDDIALTWAKGMVFEPATVHGKPVKVKMAIPIMWKSQ